jgi:tellurite resistance protein TerC
VIGVESVGTPALWIGFVAFVLTMLVVDLGVLQRRSHAVGWREALAWSGVWVSLALLFNLGIYVRFGPQRALEFFTSYLIEKALSVDNLFVFLVIFGHFGIAAAVQHRVLFWGILGALVLRAAFIVAGGALLETFHWIIYVFGGLLVFTGGKLLWQRDGHVHPERPLIVRVLGRILPVAKVHDGTHFVVRSGSRYLVTPLLLALVAVEVSDLMFAVDSIPAVFAITRDPFIVFTSNIFAILGLRALYFLLAGSLSRVRYLHVGLAGVLVFVGGKMLLGSVAEVPIGVSLAVVVLLIGASVGVSLLTNRTASCGVPSPAHGGPVPRSTRIGA